MILPLIFLVQAAAADPAACERDAARDPAAAIAAADRWRVRGGGAAAQGCKGVALASLGRWAEAGTAFEAAATASELAHDRNAASDWARAGNAWLAGGDPARARRALDAALAAGTLSGADRGEAALDRARALVAAGDTAAARADLDLALGDVPADPLAWLLSATLARRTGDGARAARDIAQAVKRSPDDAAVQLEAGNIAAQAGDAAGARAAWSAARRLQPDGSAGRSAAAALAQLDSSAN